MEKIRIEAVKWVNNGYCLGYLNSETYFISGAIPGEVVDCIVAYKNNKFKHAIVTEVIRASTQRIPSDCSTYLKCGGCSFRHILYSEELKVKKELLLKEIPFDKEVEVISANPEGYRNNVQIKVHNNQKGFYRFNTNEVVPLPESGCKNLPEELNKAISKVRANSKEVRLRLDSKGIIDYSHLESEFALHGRHLLVPPKGFFQINRYLLDKWIHHILEIVPTSVPSITELFCGSGTLSVFLAARTEALFGYELEGNAVKYAQKNCTNNKLNNTEFWEMDLYSAKASKIQSSKVWIANPPRRGLGKNVIESIQANLPDTIVYSSCNYTSLSVEVKSLLQMGYRIESMGVFDFFPRTPYFETVVELVRSY